MRRLRFRIALALPLVAAAVTIPLTTIGFASAGDEHSLTAVAASATAQAVQLPKPGLSDFGPISAQRQAGPGILKPGLSDFGLSPGQVFGQSQAASPTMKPGLSDFGLSPQRIAGPAAPAAVAEPSSGAFHWGDAGIGAGVTAGIIVLLGALLVAGRRRDRLQAT